MRYEYKFDINSCWWRNTCPYIGTEECKAHCIRYMKMYYLATNSLLTPKQQHPAKLYPENIDKDAFCQLQAIKENIVEFVNDGKNLLICSENNGNGKTQWSIKLLMRYFSKIWAKDSFNTRGLFISVARLLTALKENISESNEYVKHVRDYIYTADLVVWDDIGLKSLTPYEHDYLYQFINGRIDLGKSNIYTSNLLDDEFEKAVGDRLYSRIVNGSKVIRLYGQDRRHLND